jgi:sec-independent protein translocase protein TatA
MFAGFFDSPTEVIIILVVILVLFGGAQLPKLAKNLGKAQKEFKDGLSEGQKADEAKAAEKAADEAKS